MDTSRKPTDLIVTDKRLKFRGEGSTGLAIQDAAKQAEKVLDISSHKIKDDAVFVPLGDRVAVKRIPESELSAHGIFLPDTGKEPPSFGVVVGAGQGRYNLVGQICPIRVQNGAVVAFGKYAGTDFPLFGVASRSAEPLLCLREEEIIGVIITKEEYARIRQTAEPEITGVSPS